MDPTNTIGINMRRKLPPHLCWHPCDPLMQQPVSGHLPICQSISVGIRVASHSLNIHLFSKQPIFLADYSWFISNMWLCTINYWIWLSGLSHISQDMTLTQQCCQLQHVLEHSTAAHCGRDGKICVLFSFQAVFQLISSKKQPFILLLSKQNSHFLLQMLSIWSNSATISHYEIMHCCQNLYALWHPVRL